MDKLIVFSLLTMSVCKGLAPVGWKIVYPITPEIEKLAQKALDLYDDANTEGFAQQLLMVMRVKSQVQLGVNYQMKLMVGLLDCTEAERQQEQHCILTRKGQCTFNLLEGSDGSHNLTHSQCHHFSPS